MVRQRLDGIGLTPAQQEEIVAELAAHLEDRFEQECALGLDETSAVGHALDEVADWNGLARQIRRTKRQEEIMNHRVKSLWLPGFICLTTVMFSRLILALIGVQPAIFVRASNRARMPIEFYPSWLILLLFIGAVCAYLSCRAGGQRLARLVVVLFPCLAFLTMFCIVLPFCFVIDRHVTFPTVVSGLAFSTLNFIVFPGAALLIGAFSFLRTART